MKLTKIVAANMMVLLAIVMASASVLAQNGETEATNAWAWVMALGALTLFAVAAILYVMQYVFEDWTPTTKRIFVVAAFFCLVMGVFSAFGATLESAQVTPDEPAIYDWTASLTDNATFIIWPSQYQGTWFVDYNTTGAGSFQNNTHTAIFTLSVGRADELSGWAYDTAACPADSIGTAEGSDDVERFIIDKGTDKLFEADWTDSGGNTFNLDCTMPVSELRADSANLTVCLNAPAFDGLTAGQGSTFIITWEDYTWTITVQVRESAAL